MYSEVFYILFIFRVDWVYRNLKLIFFNIGECGVGNNWVKGFYINGCNFLEEVLDVVWKEVEGCDLI